MADAALRALVREAEARDDPLQWLRAAQGLVRAGEWDEAGWALVHARARGATDDALAAIEDALAPTTLEFEKWGVGARLTHGPLAHAVWSASGRHLYAVADGKTVLAFGHRPGQHRRVGDATGRIHALTPDLAEKKIAVAFEQEGQIVLALMDAESGKSGRAIRCEYATVNEIAAWGEPGVVVCAHRDASARAYRFDGEGNPTSETSIATLAADMGTLTWKGEIARPPAPSPDQEKALTLIFHEWHNDLGFPTTRAVHRYSERATPRLLGHTAGEIMNLSAIAASPSGRFLALLHKVDHGFELVDLVTGAKRTVPLDGLPRAAAWSPSGRRLAVTTALRVNMLEFPV